jgi:hypothetical protein
VLSLRLIYQRLSLKLKDSASANSDAICSQSAPKTGHCTVSPKGFKTRRNPPIVTLMTLDGLPAWE